MSYTLHTSYVNDTIRTIENTLNKKFTLDGDSYYEWGDGIAGEPDTHAYMFVDTMLEALAVAKLLHEAGLPSDLSERDNWSENVPPSRTTLRAFPTVVSGISTRATSTCSTVPVVLRMWN